MDSRLKFGHLTVAERIQLVEDIWDSISQTEEVLELSDAQRKELDRRIASHDARPDEAIPWASLRRELLAPD